MCAFPPVREYDRCPSLMYLYWGDYVCVPPARCNAGCPSLMHLYWGDYVWCAGFPPFPPSGSTIAARL